MTNNILKYLFSVIFILSFLFFESCDSKYRNDYGEVPTIVFEEAPESLKLSDNFKNIHCIQLEMTDESVLGRVKKIIDADGTIVVLTEDNEVTLFDKGNGKYLRHLGNMGEGPEEFLSALDMYYDPSDKTVSIFDRIKIEFVTYKLNGEFVGKRKTDGITPWLKSLVRASDGTILTCYQLTCAKPPQEYAFTAIYSNGETESFDPFAPVFVKDYTSPFADLPMSVCGDEIKYVEFLGNVIYSLKNHEREPYLNLDFGKKIPSKESVAEMGQFGTDFIYYCLNNNLLTGVNKMYETKDCIVIIPLIESTEGYYWIDKSSKKGYHFSSTNNFTDQIRKAVEGKAILDISGYTENELISCFDTISEESFLKAFSENESSIVLPEDVVSTIKNIDPEGNPFLIFYEH